MSDEYLSSTSLQTKHPSISRTRNGDVRVGLVFFIKPSGGVSPPPPHTHACREVRKLQTVQWSPPGTTWSVAFDPKDGVDKCLFCPPSPMFPVRPTKVHHDFEGLYECRLSNIRGGTILRTVPSRGIYIFARDPPPLRLKVTRTKTSGVVYI